MRHLEIRKPEHVWLTADWHLSCDGSQEGMDAISKTGRPYADCKEARESLIGMARNVLLTDDDMLLILGDLVVLDISDESLRDVLDGFPTRQVHLVLGNHDEGISDEAWQSLFGRGNVHDSLELVLPEIENDTRDGHPLCVTCCHYPLRTWKGERFGNVHLHGHLHAYSSYNDWQRVQHHRSYDVGVDANQYAPIRLSDILSFMGVV